MSSAQKSLSTQPHDRRLKFSSTDNLGILTRRSYSLTSTTEPAAKHYLWAFGRSSARSGVMSEGMKRSGGLVEENINGVRVYG